jgi:hypothetical protein
VHAKPIRNRCVKGRALRDTFCCCVCECADNGWFVTAPEMADYGTLIQSGKVKSVVVTLEVEVG